MQRSNLVLLVEDDTIDAMTVNRALCELGSDTKIIHVTNGEEALTYLRDPDRCLPRLILLDINMPKMDGIEFLQVLKSDERLHLIPVVMLTTSTNDRDVVPSFHLSAAGYMIKPVDYERFVDTIQAIEAYWQLSRVPV